MCPGFICTLFSQYAGLLAESDIRQTSRDVGCSRCVTVIVEVSRMKS